MQTTQAFPYVLANESSGWHPVARYRGNPFIEALPLWPSDEDLQREVMKAGPDFEVAHRDLDAGIRSMLVDGLYELVVPLPRVITMARSGHELMCRGYAGRKPYSLEDNDILRRAVAAQRSGAFTPLPKTSPAAQFQISLIGSSGCGKSFFVNYVTHRLYPRVIHHPRLNKWQIPVLNIEMPYDGASLHSLAENIITALDEAIPDCGYGKLLHANRRVNAEVRLASARLLLRDHAVGMLVVDEAQNEKKESDHVRKEKLSGSLAQEKRRLQAMKQDEDDAEPHESLLAKLLITASNTFHVPLMFTGTCEMPGRLSSRFSKRRRLTGGGSQEWYPLEASGHVEGPAEFEIFLKAMWKYQWVKAPVRLDNKWAKAMYLYTQGIPDTIIKLFIAMQKAAIMDGSDTLSFDGMHAAFCREFGAIAHAIEALAKNDTSILNLMPDLRRSANDGGVAAA